MFGGDPSRLFGGEIQKGAVEGSPPERPTRIFPHRPAEHDSPFFVEPQLLLFYNPVVSGSDAGALEAFKQSQRLMVFWQELFFREEGSQLPFMEKAREKERKDRKYGIPPEAFDRVGGFVFLDMAFAPDSNKTIISKSGDLRMELFDKESNSCNSRDYQRLQDDFHSKVRDWHKQFDRMVL